MTTTIIGLGLIGGSFGLSIKKHGLSDRVIGVDQDSRHARRAVELGIADIVLGLEQAVPQSDLVIVATPVDSLPEMSLRVLDNLCERAVAADVGSTKSELCRAISRHPRRGRFVATHPMWGTEYSGPEAARSDSFTGRTAVICEAERSDPDAVELIENIYRKFGMPLARMEAREHDTHTAYVSHISHITSFALALTVLEKELEEKRIFELAGGGFESTVRLAKSSPGTWVPILSENRLNILDVLDGHIAHLDRIRDALRRDDRQALGGMIREANKIRKIIDR